MPLFLFAVALLVPGWIALSLSILAAPIQLAGTLVERWLFFAEATHTVTLYYGREQIPCGQSFIEMIRFAAANQLLVDIDYRDKQGKRSTRSIEAYSLRRSQAGDVLLMAVRADSGQPRSYLVSNILGVSPTKASFSPRFPIELTPSGPHTIPATSRSTGIGAVRSSIRRTSRSTSSGPIYVYRCTVCRKLFQRKTHDSTLCVAN